ncbi:YebC/PmpR family DNA-binding transcriptional regulator [Paenibacillus doosanensis]|uniref:Probable transcriptional regulatory protein SK3146_01999 n=1 Tax=Paenibacillus konkukensis TaxID=2020716 RepID=A0ABY4RK55_9BACL|nr:MULTISPECIES: YebC/PmpR family DNA-binding transcriptional regulator [Paenibacillus]MCS7460181.1 YebC/PmpR family DNA-binding transcriptional regulator [Paenibacillus doosanensis]UQZ82839.1 putative transcriptional regulatory protein [Paenibacillus konkukensis]
MKFKLFKDRKGKADQAKNNQFVKLGREIFVAARKGGPNPDANFALKVAMESARRINMPKDNIERAIKKATGEGDNVEYEEIMYEGYGPGGIAIMVKCLTDNRNRTAADVRAVFNKRGGNMGESGCVSYMFDEKGILTIDRETHPLDEDELMMQALEAGAEDVTVSEDHFEITTHPHEFEKVKTALEGQGLEFAEANVSWVPQNTIKVEGENAEKLMKMMDSFDDLDDVQDVFSNYEIEDEEMARIG